MRVGQGKAGTGDALNELGFGGLGFSLSVK